MGDVENVQQRETPPEQEAGRIAWSNAGAGKQESMTGLGRSGAGVTRRATDERFELAVASAEQACVARRPTLLADLRGNDFGRTFEHLDRLAIYRDRAAASPASRSRAATLAS
jgi:hypothetical protein